MVKRALHAVALLAVLGLALVACETAGPGPGNLPQRPATEAPAPIPSAVAATTTVADANGPAWTSYASINQVRDLAFAPDGTLWAATGGGLVHWLPSKETYTRHLLEAREIAVAADGTLWLVTDEGLCHFDGETCLTYTAADGLLDGGISSVGVAPDGDVWAGGALGISRFDGGSWQGDSTIPHIQDLSLTPGGDVWVAASNGVHRYSPGQAKWTTYREEEGLPPAQATAIAAGPDGQVWVYLLWEGVYHFDGTRWAEMEAACDNLTTEIVVAADGTPWIASGGGTHYPGGCLAYHDGQRWIEVARQQGLMSIEDLALGPEGQLAASTSLGLAHFAGGRWRTLKDGPTRQQATAVAVTADGAAWFGFGDHSVTTTGGGLSRFDGEGWDYHLDDAEVNVLAAAPDGALWAGVGDEIQRYDGAAWETLGRSGEDLPQGHVIDIAFTPDGSAWVANYFGLGRFKDGSWTVYDKLAHSLVVAPDGTLWLNGWEGTLGSAYVARFDGEGWTAYSAADSIPGWFHVLGVTPGGQVCGRAPGDRLACYDGRAWSDARAWKFYTHAGDLSLGSITGAGVAPDGTLWLSTQNGVARFEGGSGSSEAWAAYAWNAGLGRQNHLPMAFGPGGEIWLGTNRLQP